MKRSLALALMFGLVLALGACQTLGIQTQSQKISATCATIAAAEDALSIANDSGKLSAAQVTAVQRAIDAKRPVCNVTPQPTLSAVEMAAFEAAAATISSTAKGVPQ